MKNLDYTLSTDKKGILSPEEVNFFYYDIMRDTENSAQSIYDWNSDIQSYLDSKSIIVDVMEAGTLPEKIEKDKIYFTISNKSDKENKAIAFIRHLRNAFAHFLITHEGEYLNIKDCNNEKGSMIGRIKYEDLKGLCSLFFKQRNDFMDKNNL